MKKIFLFSLILSPMMLFASSQGAEETDILFRTVNFIIFAAILWYLLADKVKSYFAQRTLDIQAELDKVQDVLKASEEKVVNAQAQLDEAKQLAAEIVENAKADVDSVKKQVAKEVETQISHLEKSSDEMMKVETARAKKQIVSEVLDELLKSENIKLSQDELANIVLKKVA